MVMVQMNVRIDGDVKERVDKILERQGQTPSALIRDVWDYVDDYGHVPDLETEAQKARKEAEKERRLKAVKEGATLWSRTLEEAGLHDSHKDPFEGMSYKEIRDLMYEEKYDEYLRESEGGEQ